MKRVYKGMVVRTSYNTGPFIVTDIKENCTCPNFMDFITLFDRAPSSRPHYHLRCKELHKKSGFYWLNGYDENLNSVWSGDHLIVCSEETTILALSISNNLTFI